MSDPLLIFPVILASTAAVIAIGLLVYSRYERSVALRLRQSQERILFGGAEGKARVTSELEGISTSGELKGLPIGTENFVSLMREWTEPTMGTTALAVQTLDILGADLPAHFKPKLVDLVKKHKYQGGYRPSMRSPASVFGGWSALALLRPIAGIEYQEPNGYGALDARTVVDLLGRSAYNEWRQFMDACYLRGQGFVEEPGDKRLGTVTTDAGQTILSNLGAPLSDQELAGLAKYLVDHCLEERQVHGKSFLVARYWSNEGGQRSFADGRATKHLVSPYSHLFKADGPFAEQGARFAETFREVSSYGTSPCVPFPGAPERSLVDTQAWYDLEQLLSDGPLGARQNGRPNGHDGVDLAEFLVESQDATGGFGFASDSHPNIHATRAAALFYRFLIKAYPSLQGQADLAVARYKMIDFVESLRVPGQVSFLGYSRRQSDDSPRNRRNERDQALAR